MLEADEIELSLRMMVPFLLFLVAVIAYIMGATLKHFNDRTLLAEQQWEDDMMEWLQNVKKAFDSDESVVS